MRTKMGILWVGAFAGSLAGGCGGVPADAESFDTENDALTNGTLVTSNTAPWSSVVLMPGCSGAKIGARRFLTAGHCNGMVNAVAGGASISVSNALDGSSPTTLGVSRFYFHPSFLANAIDVTFDASVVNVLADTPSIPTLPLDTVALTDGTLATFTGYGCNEANPTNTPFKRTLQLRTLSLAQWQAEDPTNANSVGVFVHDYLFNGGPTGASPPTFKSLCPGDSGGPLLFNRNGWKVAGINSWRALPTGDMISATTRVSGIASWANSTTPAIKGRSRSFTNLLSGKCLSAFNSGGGATAIGEEPCDGQNGVADTQYWRQLGSANPGFVLLQNGKSGLCMDLDGALQRPVQAACRSTTSSQQWLISGSTLRNARTNGYLGVLGTTGANVSLSESGNRQKWQYTP